MEKMENASKSFFDSCDFANKNIEDPNIKIEEYSKNDSSILHSSKGNLSFNYFYRSNRSLFKIWEQW